MTVSSILSRWSYTGNGATTIFAYTNRIFADSDLKVYVDGVLKTLTTDYVVSGVDSPGGGNVTFVSAPANGASVVIVRDVPATQPVDYQPNDPFPAETHEKALDRATVLVQQALDKVLRAFRLQDSDPTPEILLPTPAQRALKYLAFDAAGAPSVATEVNPGNVLVSAFMETLLDDADAAAARTTLGVVAASESAAGLGEIATQAEVDAGTDDARYVTPAKLAAWAPARRTPFRNRIINGDVRLDQRKNGGTTSISGGNAYGPDRWRGQATGTGVFEISRPADAPAGSGFQFSLKAETKTADASFAASDNYYIGQRIEGRNVADLAWGTAAAEAVTVGFWVKASAAGTYNLAVRNDALNRSYVATFTVTQAATWEFKTVTIPGDTAGTWDTADDTGIELIWALGGGSTYITANPNTWEAAARHRTSGSAAVIATLNATLQVAGVQLEAGSVATEFEHRPRPVELLLCQRYFNKTFQLTTPVQQNGGVLGALAAATSSSAYVATVLANWRFPTRMRATPTIVTYNPAAANASWRNVTAAADAAAAVQYVTDGDALIEGTVAATGIYKIHATADAEL